MSSNRLETMRRVSVSHSTGTDTWPSYPGSVHSYSSRSRAMWPTSSGPCPGPSRNAHPRPSRTGSTTATETASSSPLSARTMSARCAQGQA